MADQTLAEMARDKGAANLWRERIKAAREEEAKWRKEASDYMEVYRSQAKNGEASADFNLFYSNVQTIAPNLYNNTPVPQITRKFDDRDEIARQSAELVERAITVSLDEYDFDSVAEEAILESLIVGRGVARIRHVIYQGGNEDYPTIAYESVECEMVPWADFVRGPGRKWDQVPFIGYRHYFTKDQAVEEFGADVADLMVYGLEEDEDNDKTPSGDDAPKPGVQPLAEVWEIWSKNDRRVLWLTLEAEEDLLRVDEDPLGLAGFYDCPKPLLRVPNPGCLVPIPEYRYYRKLAGEVASLTKRIDNITKAIKACGCYDSALGGNLQELLSGEDLRMVPVDAVTIAERPLDKSIVWLPIEKLVQVRRELREEREATKQDIYEITGISDIIRGASDPQETASAQNIKSQFGGLRLNKQQRAVAGFIRDSIRIKAEIISERFKPETLALISNQPEGVGDEVQRLLDDDLARLYRIGIETDSTVAGDIQRERENMGMFMDGVAKFFATFGPAVKENQIPASLALALLKPMVRNFNLPREVEDILEGLGDEQNPEAQLAQAMQQLEQLGQQVEELTRQRDELQAVKAQTEAVKAQNDTMQTRGDLALKEREIAIDERKQVFDEAMAMRQQQVGQGSY